MVDSFFVNPKKRPSQRSSRAPNKKRKPVEPTTNNVPHDEEISSQSSEGELEEVEESSEDEFANETEADKRRRLAKEYLQDIQQELVENDEHGFDAKDLDREIISRRLREDVAETEGRVYKFLADKLNLSHVKTSISQGKPYGLTSLATNHPYAYTTSKDLVITKWDLSGSRPRVVKVVRGDGRIKSPSERESYKGHFDEILCVAVSPDGKFVVTGGRDRRIVVWAAESLAPIKVFETKDRKGVVMGLVFRRNTNELYASCADLKVRTYNLDQLAQVEILFGHQDEVADIAALGQEKCVSVGSRDRTAIMWKISEETRLTFRGADTGNIVSRKTDGKILEGSIDCCTMLDDQLFLTGSDNGTISLWSVNKKKPVYVYRESHGRDKPLNPAQVSAENNGSRVAIPEPLPKYVTTIYAIPFSDTFFTGSWSGDIKVWKLAEDQRKFDLVGSIRGAKGIVNRISVVESGPRGRESYIVLAAVSREPRLGRWMKVKGKDGLFTAVVHTK
jgi:ribosomal RNA-processing protein 9